MSFNTSRLVAGLLSTVFIGFAVVPAGCAGTSPKPKAAQSLGCGIHQVEIEGGGAYDATAIATGCGKKDVLYRDKNGWASLRERAAFEMSCGAGELEITVVESYVFGATGCGHRIVYKFAPYVGMVVQTASDVAPTAAPAEAAAPAAPAPTAPNASEPDVTADDIALPEPPAQSKTKKSK